MRIADTMEKVQAKRAEVLKALVENRETHKKIVIEARKGYMEKARAALKKRLDELESGKIVSLSFSLAPPQDHTKVYDTAIKMMELETRDVVLLDASQVRSLVMDEWDWTSHFLLANAGYSGTASARIGNDAVGASYDE